MKQTEQKPVQANDNAPLPRFLSGIFRRGKPAAVAAGAPSGGSDKGSSGAHEVVPAVPPVNGKRAPKILVVDDDPVILKTVGMKLSRAGCQVLTGHEGAEAISLARKERPDVIVLDVCFPAEVAVAWDGVRIMQWLQRLEQGEVPPLVIMISGDASGGIRERALASGAIAFFQKPVDTNALIEAIRKALVARDGGGGAAPDQSFSVH